MKIGRIAEAFPWQTGLILATALCLSAITSWVWFTKELPPLQRYYLRAYWNSSRTADDPRAVTEVQWIDLTAPSRKEGWPLDADVEDDPFDDSEVGLSYQALAKGWTGIRVSPPDPVRSVELKAFLRRGIYHGRDLRQLLIEPACYACCAVLLALFVAWRMRDDIGTEWSDLSRAILEPESVWESGGNIPLYRQTIRARIRNRIAESLATLNCKRKRFSFARVTTHRSAPQLPADSQSAPDHTRSSLSSDNSAGSMVPRISNPGAAAQMNGERNGHLVFPGSSRSFVPSKDANAWHETEWID